MNHSFVSFPLSLDTPPSPPGSHSHTKTSIHPSIRRHALGTASPSPRTGCRDLVGERPSVHGLQGANALHHIGPWHYGVLRYSRRPAFIQHGYSRASDGYQALHEHRLLGPRDGWQRHMRCSSVPLVGGRDCSLGMQACSNSYLLYVYLIPANEPWRLYI